MADSSERRNLAAAWDHLAAAAHCIARSTRGSTLAAGAPPRRPPLPHARARHGHHRRPDDLQLTFGFDDGADAPATARYGYHHHRDDLELGFDYDYGADGLELGFHYSADDDALPDHRHRHDIPPPRHGEHRRRHRHDLGSDDDDDDGGADPDADASSGGGDSAHADPGGGAGADAGDDDDFTFAVEDLCDLSYALGVCVPPYPVYRGLTSYRDVHGVGWIWIVFCYTVSFSQCS